MRTRVRDGRQKVEDTLGTLRPDSLQMKKAWDVTRLFSSFEYLCFSGERLARLFLGLGLEEGKSLVLTPNFRQVFFAIDRVENETHVATR
jgi:hypothetical protein